MKTEISEQEFKKALKEEEQIWWGYHPAADHDAAEEMNIQALQAECDSCQKPSDVPCIDWIVGHKCKSKEWYRSD
jgi:hypothetical protein